VVALQLRKLAPPAGFYALAVLLPEIESHFIVKRGTERRQQKEGNMAKTLQKLGLMSIALLLILGCATSSITPPPPGFVETSIAGTYSVAASQTAKVQAQYTNTQLATLTATKTASATPFPTYTLVVLGPSELLILVNVSCRRGPGDAYEQVYRFRKGEIAELVGRSADGGYWIVRNPNRPERLCWIPRVATVVSRLTGNIPAMTPPRRPTPARTPRPTDRPANTRTFTPGAVTGTPTETQPPVPDFDLVYDGVDDCATTPAWWLNFELGNIGDVDFDSISINLRDNTAGTDYSLSTEDFIDNNGCGPALAHNVLPVGLSRIVSAPELGFNPAGGNFTVTITLCDEPGWVGLFCVTKTLTVTP
jgi:hypothetical protein